MASSIAKRLADNLGGNIRDSYWDAYKVIPENSVSNLFAERFGIKENNDREKFHQAFRVCTEGQGNELKSINNVISSALLPLLTFFRLFGENSGYSLGLKLDDNSFPIVFDRCFFEVRNAVIRLPSCVDVALYSSHSKVMLFLESKLFEYNRVSKYLEIKDGYAELYNDKELQKILNAGGIRVEGNKLTLVSGGKAYFEGIKQTISHLIGLVQGPSQNRKGVYYPNEYLDAYEECYKYANTIGYATIILNPETIGVPRLNDDFKKYEKYVELYTKTIGTHGDTIVDCIRNCPRLKEDKGKTIKVLDKPLDYHEVFANNSNLLIDVVKEFYKFGG